MSSIPMIPLQPPLPPPPALPPLRVSPDARIRIRRARAADVEAICRLVNYYAAQEVMLPKTPIQVYSNLRLFMIAEAEGELAGCAALKLTWANPAEIVSLAVRPEFQGRGVGRDLVEALIDEAHEIGEPTLFALTLRPKFFAGLGFRRVEKHILPHKVWNECSVCPKRERCDEIAMLREI